jgi:hypothetical protein
MLATGFHVGGAIMMVVGAAGTTFGLRTLRPQVRDIEEYLKATTQAPRPWSSFFASAGVVLGLVSLLIGLMLFMFGAALVVLSL